jgi:LysR family transcriptional regulator, nitrogen assimilation regulatory protein
VQIAREALGAVRGALSGRVSVGLPPSLSRLITVPLTHAFKARLPEAHLSLTEGFSMLMHEGLRTGNLDMAVLYNAAPSLDIEVTALHKEELVLISKKTTQTPQLPISLAAVAALPLILPSRPNTFRILLDAEMNAIGTAPNITLEVDALNAILSLVKEGLGHAVLPSYTLSNFGDREQLMLRRIKSPRITSALSLVRPTRRPITQTQKVAFEIVNAVVTQAVKAYR